MDQLPELQSDAEVDALMARLRAKIAPAPSAAPDQSPTPAASDDALRDLLAAQGMYVQTQSGWFSDRTARYLAAGKPVLVQNTGFAYPESGEGVLVFDTLSDAARGADGIARDYSAHSEAARWIAERYFNSDTELGRILETARLA